MQDTQAFAPFYKVSQSGQTGTLFPSVTVAATASSAVASGVIPGGLAAQQMQVANLSLSAWAYVNFGAIRDTQVVTAATVASSLPVPPLSVKVFSVDPEVNGASVILTAAASACNVIFTRGQGIG